MMHHSAAFVDFEASGLAPGSYPIEAGWAIAQTGCSPPLGGSMLILHKPWLLRADLWDPGAEIIHRIDRQMLKREGCSARLVAMRLAEALADFSEVFTDNGEWDRRWCQMLFQAAGIPMPFQVRDWRIVFDDGPYTDEVEFERLHAKQQIAKIAPRTHRARDDALSMATLWWMTRRQL